MKRNIITLIIVVFAMMQTTAQTYDNLWKQADIIAQKDQPKSEIGVMQKILQRCLSLIFCQANVSADAMIMR